MGAQAAKTPAGEITAVFSDDASREGAFRLMGNEAVRAAEIARAANGACARRSVEHTFVFVPVDGSSLNLTDTKRAKGLGSIGSRRVGAQGIKVMSAIAVSPKGVPLGVCGQHFWTRTSRSTGRQKHDRRKTEEKETQNWLTVMDEVREVFQREAAATKPWFQIDREGDSWPILLTGLDADQMLTVRASYDRRLQGGEDEPRRYLWEALEKQPVLGTYTIDVPARPERAVSRQRRVKARPARVATIEVKACKVELSLLDYRSGVRKPISLWAVLALERLPKGSETEPIEWLLLTTVPAPSFEQARQVIFGYTQRWRIEDFHKLWKSGACRVEDTQLRARSHIIRWATILASVAMRILRMTYLARHHPETPATEEFSQAELDAIFLASPKTRHRRGQTPTISEAVFLLAKVGSYTGKASGGPPGSLVIARGLSRIQLLADTLAAIPLLECKKM
jgi:hypothetical protein